jgi:hypothetical protein
MSDNRYQLAGWLSIAGAVLMVPLVVSTIFVEKMSAGALWVIVLISAKLVVSMLVSVYIYCMFKKLLNERYKFHRVDTLILIFIGATILYFILGVMGLFPQMERTMAVISMALFVPFGVVNILLGVNILKLDDDLFGFLKPYAYLTITAGVFAVTLVLAPLGMLAAITTLFIQGMIFLRVKEQLEFV